MREKANMDAEETREAFESWRREFWAAAYDHAAESRLVAEAARCGLSVWDYLRSELKREPAIDYQI